MPVERSIRVTYDEETGEHRKFTFDEFVTPVVDHTLIENRSFLYFNSEHPADEALVEHVAESAWKRTGLSVEAWPTTLDRLRVTMIPLSQTQVLRFMAGHPIWLLPTMFAKVERGTKYQTEIGEVLNEATAITAAFAKTVINNLFERDYAEHRYRFPEGGWHARAMTHSKEIIANALGLRPAVGRDDGRRLWTTLNIDEVDNDGRPTGRTIIGSKRYTVGSARTIARNTIDWLKNGGRGRQLRNGERINFYNACVQKIAQEVEHSQQTFGREIDGMAVATWYHRIITSLRVAAAVSANIDARRSGVSRKLSQNYAEFEGLWRERDTLADDAPLSDLHEQMDRTVRTFKTYLRRSLRVLDNGRELPDAEPASHIGPTTATIVAFYAGIDLRAIVPDLCVHVGEDLDAILTSAVWLGRLHRDRGRDLTADTAAALTGLVDHERRSAEQRGIVEHCMEIAFSFLEQDSRAELLRAAHHTLQSGEPWTVTLAYKDLVEPNPLERASDRAGENAQHQADNDGEPTGTEMFFHPELATYASAYRPLRLCGTFLTLPPYYERDWADQWEMQEDQDHHFARFVRRIRRPRR